MQWQVALRFLVGPIALALVAIAFRRSAAHGATWPVLLVHAAGVAAIGVTALSALHHRDLGARAGLGALIGLLLSLLSWLIALMSTTDDWL